MPTVNIYANLTPEDLSTRLGSLKWSGLELARRVVASPSTVYNWLNGRRRIPGSVWAYTDVALQLKVLGDSLGRSKKHD